VTIYIIIAIVIAGAVIVVFFPTIKNIVVPSTPSVRVDNCVMEYLDEAVELVSKHGGSIDPENALVSNGVEIEYLCFTNQYYQTCSIQRPLLRQHMEEEILSHIKKDVEQCVSDVEQELIDGGYSVSRTSQEIKVDISNKEIKVILPGLSFVKEDISGSYNRFEVIKRSELYQLVMITTSILNWEARYGDIETTDYMLAYPNLKVEKLKQQDGSKIYILTNTDTDEKFSFATRSLSWPGGYGVGEVYTPAQSL